MTTRFFAMDYGAVFTDILHFRARVLGVYGQGLFHGQPLPPETVSAVPSSDRVVRFSRPSPPRHKGPVGPAIAGDGQQSVVTRLCRVMDTSRRPPICWPQRGPVVRRPRLTSGPRGPYLPCQSTSRPASARETPNAEAEVRVDD